MLTAFSVHVAMLYMPFGNALLGTEPVGARLWLLLFALSLSILALMELHKLSWYLRYRRTARKSLVGARPGSA